MIKLQIVILTLFSSQPWY